VKHSETTIEEKELERIFYGFTFEAQRQLTSQLQKPKKKLLIIAGPTAVGKSSLALSLAEMMGGEIVSADSMQVYCGMDIATAKPSKEERERVPHHLIDIHNINEPFNVVDFYYEARHSCQQVFGDKNIPLLVGGSGFYLHAFIYGPPCGPPSVPEVRKALEEEIEQKGSDLLYERLKQVDLQYANTITKNDKQKIVRALEILTLTGNKVSKFSWKGRLKPQNYDFRCWFLHRPREQLYQRIEQRCDEMIKRGLLEEAAYLEKLGLRQNASAAQAIGYRQALEFLDSPRSENDFQRFVESFKQASRNYAKRQFTWFRKEPLFRWLDMDLHDPEVAMEIIRKDYEASI
jgi:tRNA dimethylallyltransferase